MDKDTDFQMLKIGELAAMAGVSPKALRVYEKKNVIKPVYVDEETGYRYYSPDQFREIESLLALQDMGFTLNEISKILSGKCSREQLSILFEAKKGALQEEIWRTEAKIKELDSMKKSFEEEAVADKIKEMSDEERAKYLSRLVILNEENVRQILSDVVWL